MLPWCLRLFGCEGPQRLPRPPPTADQTPRDFVELQHTLTSVKVLDHKDEEQSRLDAGALGVSVAHGRNLSLSWAQCFPGTMGHLGLAEAAIKSFATCTSSG